MKLIIVFIFIIMLIIMLMTIFMNKTDNVSAIIPNEKEFFKYINQESNDIPNIVYTYIGNGKVPEEFKQNIHKYETGLKIQIYTTENSIEFLNIFGSNAITFFNSLEHNDKEKFMAYCLLYINGGYYINSKCQLQRQIGNLNPEFFYYNDVTNGVKVLITKPGQKLLYNIILTSLKSNTLVDIHNTNNTQYVKIKEKYDCNDDLTQFCNYLYKSNLSLDDEVVFQYNLFDKNWMNNKIDVIYLISMPNRLEYMKNILHSLNQYNYVVIEPIKKVDIDIEQIYNEKKIMYKLPLGKIACHLSHIKALQFFLQSNYNNCLILEDDIKLPHIITLQNDVENVIDNVPIDWEILFLGKCYDDCERSVYYNKYICSSSPLCRHAYMVNAEGAKKIISNTFPMYDAGDMMYKDIIKKGDLISYSPINPIFFQNRNELTSQVLYTGNSLPICKNSYYKFKQKTLNVIVPIRNRDEHLELLLKTLNPILIGQGIIPYWYIIEQSPKYKFNKGMLNNVGFIEACKYKFSDNFLFTDADTFPLKQNVYSYNKILREKIYHIFGNVHCLGGCFLISEENYLKINGFSNNYWGWGYEDTDLQKRAIILNIPISRDELITPKYNNKHKIFYYDRSESSILHSKNQGGNDNVELYNNNIRKYAENINSIYKDGVRNCEYKTIKEYYNNNHQKRIMVELKKK